jgi:hypothetical protein
MQHRHSQKAEADRNQCVLDGTNSATSSETDVYPFYRDGQAEKLSNRFLVSGCPAPTIELAFFD